MFLFLQYNIINPYLSYCSVNFSVFYVIFLRVLRIRKLSKRYRRNIYVIVFIFRKSTKEILSQLKRPLNNASGDNESDSDALEQEERINVKKAKQRKRATAATQRFRWKKEMVQTLLGFLNELKSQYEYKGLDFEADLVRVYTELRVMMAEHYVNGEFGPASVSLLMIYQHKSVHN